ncbi:Actin- protein 6 [Phytophthora boehmeriae]|uniref:Actin- protein 6 n=1 Tax=Phytophthora boehmeriae TaxID=109152 RepID=A0A8T1VZF3_9STRA|nr:Actin- protein 6 [Phytophthora boehmeriae]
MSSNPSTLFMGESLRELEHKRANLRYLRPIERGYCVNWNVESELWNHLLSNEVLKVDPAEHSLVTTAPLFPPTVVNDTMDQVVFEELGFQSYTRVNAAEMCVLSYSEFCENEYQDKLAAAHNVKRNPNKKRRKKADASSPSAEPVVQVEDPFRFSTSSCQLVVDSGFSFTHVVPLIDGKVFLPGVKRINVGGKLLTNYLKEIVSFRQWNVMDDTPVINELKEALCYCSTDFDNDLRRYHTDRRQRKHWVLPDFVHSFEGRVREQESEKPSTEPQPMSIDDNAQALEMGVEMITVPEVLFHPSDIDIHQAGIAETIVHAVEACPVELSCAFYANILLVGGNTNFKNFRQRLEQDLRPLVPDEFEIGLHTPPE